MSDTLENTETRRNSRGDHVGKSTPSTTIKHLWRKSKSSLSLKAFARQLLKENDQSAKDWFSCKRGAKDLERSEKNVGLAQLAAQASKAARRKK